MVEMSDWGKYAQWKRFLAYTPILGVLPIPLFLRLAPIGPGDNTTVVEGDIYGLVEEVI